MSDKNTLLNRFPSPCAGMSYLHRLVPDEVGGDIIYLDNGTTTIGNKQVKSKKVGAYAHSAFFQELVFPFFFLCLFWSWLGCDGLTGRR